MHYWCDELSDKKNRQKVRTSWLLQRNLSCINFLAMPALKPCTSYHEDARCVTYKVFYVQVYRNIVYKMFRVATKELNTVGSQTKIRVLIA